MIQDFIGLFYLLWPGLFLLSFFVFLAGFLFAISLGSAFAIGILLVYYAYIHLKKRGFFDWLSSKQKLFGEKLLSHIRSTFLLKGDLNGIPNGPVLYIAHPHGLFSMAPFLHWASQVTEWPFHRKVHIAIHSIFFSIPIVREICESFGAIEATDSEIRRILEKGESVALLTGGVHELTQTEPGKLKLVLKKRRGFARVAFDLKIPIIPVLTFGENELFPPLQGGWTSIIQQSLYKFLRVSIPLPTFASIKNWFSLLKGPLLPPVETWIGSPILPSKEKNVETLRETVLQGFTNLYTIGKPTSFHGSLEFL